MTQLASLAYQGPGDGDRRGRHPGADHHPRIPVRRGLRSGIARASTSARSAAWAVLAFAASLPIYANEESGEAATFLGLPRWLWLWLNLLLFLGILGYFLVPPIKRFLETRTKEIGSSLEKARTQHQEARRMETDLSGQIDALRKEMEELVRRTEADAERERVEILAHAERERERLLEQTKQEVTLRVSQARKELQRYAAELAAQLARERIEREVDPEALGRLFDESLARLEGEDG